MIEPDENIKPSAMTKSQLAAAYGICVETFNKWIEPFLPEIGERKGTNIYTPAQVSIIFDKLGKP